MQKQNGFTPDWIEKLRYNNDIVSVISKYVTLNRRGGSYWACCPFHHEKTPSFSVNQQGQFFHCFGCGVGGDVIKFVEMIEGTSFFDTVKILAKNAGMEVPKLELDEQYVKEQKKRELLKSICKETAIYYNKVLNSSRGKKGLEYLQNRGVSASTITRLGLGYSDSWQGLVTYLKNKHFSNSDLLESGVCGERDGKLFDEMAMRVVFPVIDHRGDVVGFSGRALEKTAFAKYKNTKATPLFNKSSNIYCINFLRKERLNTNYAILVEGQMDVVALQQAGFGNAIATMGTAFNKNHIDTLKRFVDSVVVCFDGDSAGQNATVKSLAPLLQEGFGVKVMSIPEKLDPDEYIKKYGKEKFAKLIEDALPVYDFEIRHQASLYDLNDREQVTKFIDSAIQVVAGMQKESERQVYSKLVAEISKVPVETILRQLSTTKIKPKTEEKPEKEHVVQVVKTKNYAAEQFVLASIIHKKPYVSVVEIEDFVNNSLKSIYKYIQDNNYPIVSKLYDDFDVDENLDVKNLINYDFAKIAKPEQEWAACVLKMKIERLQREQEQINAQIVNCTDENVKNSMLKRASELSKEIIEKKNLLNKVG